MAYIFYFFGFVQAYKLSEYFADEETPMWYHLLIGFMWPSIVLVILIYDFYILLTVEDEE